MLVNAIPMEWEASRVFVFNHSQDNDVKIVSENKKSKFVDHKFLLLQALILVPVNRVVMVVLVDL